MQTAVTWLLQELEKVNYHPTEAMIIYAKKLEKQQIIDAFYQCGRDNFEHIKVINRSATEYYNETYGSKGSDEHIVDTNEMISSQTEISDEMSKIEKALYHAWSDYEYQEGNLYSTTFRDGWLMAIKWYREQLKKKQ
jgi:hypothetical protein